MKRWGFFNPYFQIGLGALLVTASELLMKSGANNSPAAGIFGFAALGSWHTWLGIVLYCLSFLSWIYVLRTIPLGIAYGLINIVHVLIPLGCWVFLGEAIAVRRWAGIALVLAGLALVVKPVADMERKLEASP